jgi:polysaccharide biosynthesis transport protein
VAANLAAVIAQSNKRVVLLDCDLRRPRVHKQLGMTNNHGLSDIFRGHAEIKDVIRAWKSNFAVITSGSLPPNPAELLASEKMDEILEMLKAHGDVVIIDSPPFLVTDATLLAAKVDGVVLVVRPGHTEAAPARALGEQMQRAGARVVGVVLNNIPMKGGYGYYYGGHHNYHYAPYYYGERQEGESERQGRLSSRFSRLANLLGRKKAPASSIGEEV